MPTLVKAPDTEQIVRAFVRSLVIPGLGNRVFFGVPRDPVYPLVEFARIGGSLDQYAPVDTGRFSFNVWADTGSGGKAKAAELAGYLVGSFQAFDQTGTSWTSGTGADQTIVDGCEVVLGPLWRPDPTTHLARYVVDALFTIRRYPAG